MAATGASFRRVFGVAVVAGLTLGVATPAFAATDDDCTSAPTFNATSGDDAADIQGALDAGASLICLSGTFLVTTTLDVDHDVTLHGLSDAVLDGGDAAIILWQTVSSTSIVENMRFTRGYNLDGQAGAIVGSTVIIRNSTFDHNSGDYSGAVYAGYDLSIENSRFTDNSALRAAGAVVSYSGSVSVVDSTFERNTAGDNGGAIFAYGVSSVTGSTFVDNTAGDAGGAIIALSQLTVTNSTFVRNRSIGASVGGAIAAVDSSVEYSTFIDNSAVDEGNSIYAYSSSSVRGSIFAGSLSPQLSTAGVPATDLGGNLFTSTGEPSLAASTSTLFGLTTLAIFGTNTLAGNGGPTQTVAISPTGPAVDAVPAGSALTVDQRGVTRAGVADAGSVEVGVRQAALAATGVEAGWLAALAAGLLGLGLAMRQRRHA